jgi:hypothetical protein
MVNVIRVFAFMLHGMAMLKVCQHRLHIHDCPVKLIFLQEETSSQSRRLRR